MAYATPQQLADALRIRVTEANTSLLTACVDAAAEEIDHDLDRLDPLPVPPPAAVERSNVNRAVEWFKATDAAYGVIGYEQTGVLQVPNDNFARHAVTLTPWKQQWGVA